MTGPSCGARACVFPAFSQQLAKEQFFEFLDFALQFAPAAPNEFWIREQLSRIGVGPTKSFNFRELPAQHKAEVMLGLIEGKKKVDAAVESVGQRIDGWSIADVFGDAAFYHGDWLLRAAAAQAGIYSNVAEETVYPMTRWETDGSTARRLVARVSQSEWVEIPEFHAGFRWRDGFLSNCLTLATRYTITFPKNGLPG